MSRKPYLKKRQGDALPFYAVLTAGFVISLLLLLVHWEEFLYSADDAKNGITISAQAVCLHDPVASSLFTEKEDLVFYSGSRQESMKYYSHSGRITRLACENALKSFEKLLGSNLPLKYKGYVIESFEMKNVLGGMAYTYDAVTGDSASFAAPGGTSSLHIEMKVVRDSIFGEIAIPLQETVYLKEK